MTVCRSILPGWVRGVALYFSVLAMSGANPKTRKVEKLLLTLRGRARKVGKSKNRKVAIFPKSRKVAAFPEKSKSRKAEKWTSCVPLEHIRYKSKIKLNIFFWGDITVAFLPPNDFSFASARSWPAEVCCIGSSWQQKWKKPLEILRGMPSEYFRVGLRSEVAYIPQEYCFTLYRSNLPHFVF